MSFNNIPHCDVFYPNKKEFGDFSAYVTKIQKIANSGIVKVNVINLDCSTEEL
jgi:hypothetical protein